MRRARVDECAHGGHIARGFCAGYNVLYRTQTASQEAQTTQTIAGHSRKGVHGKVSSPLLTSPCPFLHCIVGVMQVDGPTPHVGSSEATPADAFNTSDCVPSAHTTSVEHQGTYWFRRSHDPLVGRLQVGSSYPPKIRTGCSCCSYIVCAKGDQIDLRTGTC